MEEKEDMAQEELTPLQQVLAREYVFTPFQGLGLFPIGAVMNVSREKPLLVYIF